MEKVHPAPRPQPTSLRPRQPCLGPGLLLSPPPFLHHLASRGPPHVLVAQPQAYTQDWRWAPAHRCWGGSRRGLSLPTVEDGPATAHTGAMASSGGSSVPS